MFNAGSLYIDILADDSKFNKSLEKLDFSKLGKSMNKLGTDLTKKVTVPLVAAGGAILKIGDNFDKASNIIRVGTGATGEALDDLYTSFKNVYGSFPTDTETAASVLADLNTRTGLQGDALEDLSLSFLRLSKITGNDVSGSIVDVTRFFGDWGIEADAMTDSMDKLFNVSQMTGIGVDKLAKKAVQFGAPLRSMGFEIDEVLVLLGKWEQEGVNTELVLGSMRQALGVFAREGVPDTREALEKLIRSISDAGSEAEATSLSMEYFGARAGADMAAAIREGRFEIEDFLRELNDYPETIEKAANDTMSLGDKFTLLKNKISSSLEPLGELGLELAESMIPTFERWADSISKVVEAFMGLDTKTQDFILKALLLVAALGPVVKILGSLFTLIGWIKAGFAKLAASKLVTALTGSKLGVAVAALGSKFLLIAAIVAAVVAVGYALYKRWDDIKASFMALQPVYEKYVKPVFEGIAKLAIAAVRSTVQGMLFIPRLIATVFGKLWDWLGERFGFISKWASRLGFEIDNPFNKAIDGMDNFIGFFDDMEAKIGSTDIMGDFNDNLSDGLSQSTRTIESFTTEANRMFAGVGTDVEFPGVGPLPGARDNINQIPLMPQTLGFSQTSMRSVQHRDSNIVHTGKIVVEGANDREQFSAAYDFITGRMVQEYKSGSGGGAR